MLCMCLESVTTKNVDSRFSKGFFLDVGLKEPYKSCYSISCKSIGVFRNELGSLGNTNVK